jgi:hypothetical protein
MSSIPGPIIRFVVDTPGLAAAVAPAMQQVRQQAQATSAAIADDWKRMSAQIRASIATGVTTQTEMRLEQQKLVGVLDQQISVLRTRNDLTNKELASLRSMTLERERQADAIARGAKVGVTEGTRSALSGVGFQTTMGLERMLDSLVNRYFGGAAGAAFRTARDVQYYSAIGGGTGVGGGTGTGSGMLGFLGTPGGMTIAGLAGLGAAATALTTIAVKGGNLSVELTKLSEKTGLTVDEVIKLRSASEVLDANFDSMTIGFKKLSTELNLASTANLPNSSKAAKEAAAVFTALGVDVKKAAQDPFQAVQQLSKTFSGLPDGVTKTAAATLLFGRGASEWIPVLDKLNPALSLTAKSSQDLATALGGGKGIVESAEKIRADLVNFKNESDALEVALSKRLLPSIVSIVNWINEHTPQIKQGAEVVGAIASGGGSLVAPYANRAMRSFLDIANFGAGSSASSDANAALSEAVAAQSAAASAEALKTMAADTERVRQHCRTHAPDP